MALVLLNRFDIFGPAPFVLAKLAADRKNGGTAARQMRGEFFAPGPYHRARKSAVTRGSFKVGSGSPENVGL